VAVKVGTKLYKCGYCGIEYSDPARADSCNKKHELIYVPISKGDLNRLINFLFSKDEALISKTLIETLMKYLKGNV
jgi:hypothetical protein